MLKSHKQMYRMRFIYYCMTSRGDNENCTVLFFCCNCIDQMSSRIGTCLTYPWPPVALVTAVLRVSSGTSSIDSIFSDITCKSAAVNLDANFLSLQPTMYNPSHSAMTTTEKFIGSAGPRSTSGTLSVQF
ncbi:hypothetical protein T12_7369 [Trichinella patagoniensis]|uniref:Uncharacterized protein n=1 Tax=Trichinella patagoniensis TaxID=990121 RepID=A0A0V1A5K7_9BILA|nr:hypothetical protein T12_7369 [Trichinella patagoniensis]